MRYFICLILFISCGSEVNNTPINDLAPSKDNNNNRISTSILASEYEKNIDIFVAFLWPMKIETTQAQRSTQNILELGRSLRSGNEELLGATIEFNRLKCEQIFSGEIIVEFEVEDYCYELEDIRLNLTALMLEKVTEMKADVLKIGGEWLDSNQDFESSEGSTINFNSKTLSIFSMGHKIVDGERSPLAYSKVPFTINSLDSYSYLEMSFSRIGRAGTYEVKADLNIQKSSVIFQGDLNLINNGVLQRGIIYWQVLKK